MDIPTYQAESIVVIGDVHGQYKKLINLLEQLPKNVKICFVGDLIDRGYENRKCVKIAKKHFTVIGNHEEMMIEYFDELEDKTRTNFSHYWIGNGGHTTIKEYKTIDEIDNDLTWMKSLPFAIRFKIQGHKNLIVSHADISPFINDDGFLNYEEILNKYGKDEEEVRDYTLWNRMHRKNTDEHINTTFVFGHTITHLNDIYVNDTKICIDNGAFEDNGYLIGYQYPENKIFLGK